VRHPWTGLLTVVLLAAATLPGCNSTTSGFCPGPADLAQCVNNSLPPAGFVYVANGAPDDTISAYTIGFANGEPTPISGSPYPVGGLVPAGLALMFSSTPQFLYLGSSGGATFTGFSINSETGALTSIPGSPFTSTGNNPAAIGINPSFPFLYAANAGSNNISVFAINPGTGALTSVGLPTSVNFSPNGLVINPPGGFLYVSTLSGANGDLEGFSINPVTGALTPIAGSPFASFLATAVVIPPSGNFLYAADEAGFIHVFSIGAGGTLAEINGSPFVAGNEPFSMDLDPLGGFLYAANFVSDNVSAYSIDAATGALSPIIGSPFAVGHGPRGVSVFALGGLVYVTNGSDNSVSAFTINALTGVLTPITGSRFPSGTAPHGIIAFP